MGKCEDPENRQRLVDIEIEFDLAWTLLRQAEEGLETGDAECFNELLFIAREAQHRAELSLIYAREPEVMERLHSKQRAVADKILELLRRVRY